MRREDIEAGRVAAWVIKCNPSQIYNLTHPSSDIWDRTRHQPVDGSEVWSLGTTYRSALVAPGHRCFFWVSDDVNPTWVSGLWGECDVLQSARAGRGNGRAWIDRDRMRRTVPYVPVHISFYRRPVPKADIRAHRGLVDGELVKTPNRSNPLALSTREVAILDRLVAKHASSAP